MRWPWRLRRAIEPRPMVSRAMELETAKEILAEVFGARSGEVEEMIQRRLEERSWDEEKNICPDENEGKLWPATFCLGD
ncbi:MAG: hypothetical protein NTU95_02025 [Methanothrix sp.]|nr:hypothetical protein [Methanothrix sp.]